MNTEGQYEELLRQANRLRRYRLPLLAMLAVNFMLLSYYPVARWNAPQASAAAPAKTKPSDVKTMPVVESAPVEKPAPAATPRPKATPAAPTTQAKTQDPRPAAPNRAADAEGRPLADPVVQPAAETKPTPAHVAASRVKPAAAIRGSAVAQAQARAVWHALTGRADGTPPLATASLTRTRATLDAAWQGLAAWKHDAANPWSASLAAARRFGAKRPDAKHADAHGASRQFAADQDPRHATEAGLEGVATASAASDERLLIVNPPENRAVIGFAVNDFVYWLHPGQKREWNAGGPWRVEFHRGGEFDAAAYRLPPGAYVFQANGQGWELQAAP